MGPEGSITSIWSKDRKKTPVRIAAETRMYKRTFSRVAVAEYLINERFLAIVLGMMLGGRGLSLRLRLRLAERFLLVANAYPFSGMTTANTSGSS